MESRGSGRSRWRQSAWVQIPALPLPGCATLDLASVSHPQSRNHHGTRHGCIWVFRCHSPGLALCPFLLAPLSQTPHSWRQDERHAPGCHPSSHPNRKRGLHSLRLQLKSQASLPLAEKMQGSDWSVLGHMPPTMALAPPTAPGLRIRGGEWVLARNQHQIPLQGSIMGTNSNWRVPCLCHFIIMCSC